MAWLGALAAIVLIAVVLIDAFEVMILPRRVPYAWRLTRLFYQTGWIAWRAACRGFGRAAGGNGSSASSARCRCSCSSACGPWG